MNEKNYLNIEVLDDSCVLKSWKFCATESKTLCVIFSSIGDSTHVIQKPEMINVGTQEGTVNAIWFADPNRSWLNSDGLLGLVIKRIEDFATKIGAERIISFGGSLGGFSALSIASYTHINCAVGLSPQFSVDPLIIKEQRWREYLDKIKTFRVHSVADNISQDTDYFAVFGALPRDRLHKAEFAKIPQINMWLMPNVAHNVPNRLKLRGILMPFIGHMINREYIEAQQLLMKHVFAYPSNDGPINQNKIPRRVLEHESKIREQQAKNM